MMCGCVRPQPTKWAGLYLLAVIRPSCRRMQTHMWLKPFWRALVHWRFANKQDQCLYCIDSRP